MANITPSDFTLASAPWASRRLGVLICAYLEAVTGPERRYVARLIREFVRFNTDMLDLIPGDVWVEIYRVRATGTVAP